MFPFNLFKKKEEVPLDENTLPIQQDLPLQRDLSGIDKEDLILSKLETINAKLDNINERLKKIEEIASS
ncbi:MAG: hypothetical protein AABW57_01905 [Nanoarchaeota archaeon]